MTTPSILAQDPWVNHALALIWKNYGVDTYIADKIKDLLKFGRSDQVNSSTYATLMTLPVGTTNETYLAGNLITTVSSDDAADTEVILVEGHTIDGDGNLTFVAQEVTLLGLSQATLTTPLARCSRLFNTGSTDLVGNIFAYEDDTDSLGVPDTDAGVHCMIRAGRNQSEKCATSLSSVDYWIITSMQLDVLQKTAAFADAELQVRELGGVFRPVALLAASAGSGSTMFFKPHIVVPANADIRVQALGNGTIEVSAELRGVMATTRQ